MWTVRCSVLQREKEREREGAALWLETGEGGSRRTSALPKSTPGSNSLRTRNTRLRAACVCCVQPAVGVCAPVCVAVCGSPCAGCGGFEAEIALRRRRSSLVALGRVEAAALRASWNRSRVRHKRVGCTLFVSSPGSVVAVFFFCFVLFCFPFLSACLLLFRLPSPASAPVSWRHLLRAEVDRSAGRSTGWPSAGPPRMQR